MLSGRRAGTHKIQRLLLLLKVQSPLILVALSPLSLPERESSHHYLLLTAGEAKAKSMEASEVSKALSLVNGQRLETFQVAWPPILCFSQHHLPPDPSPQQNVGNPNSGALQTLLACGGE